MAERGAREELMDASNAVSGAVQLLSLGKPTMEAFLKECRNMENFGSVLHPTLYRDPERRATAALLEPVFGAALKFLHEYETQKARAQEALAKVNA